MRKERQIAVAAVRQRRREEDWNEEEEGEVLVVILVVLVVMVAVVVNIHTWSLLPLTFMCPPVQATRTRSSTRAPHAGSSTGSKVNWVARRGG